MENSKTTWKRTKKKKGEEEIVPVCGNPYPAIPRKSLLWFQAWHKFEERDNHSWKRKNPKNLVYPIMPSITIV